MSGNPPMFQGRKKEALKPTSVYDKNRNLTNMENKTSALSAKVKSEDGKKELKQLARKIGADREDVKLYVEMLKKHDVEAYTARMKERRTKVLNIAADVYSEVVDALDEDGWPEDEAKQEGEEIVAFIYDELKRRLYDRLYGIEQVTAAIHNTQAQPIGD